MNFIGRKAEIDKLTKAFKTDRYEGILVYGRRRVGKTELIKEAISSSNITYIYYECQKVNEASNTECFSEIISHVFNIPSPFFKSFEKAIEYIFEKAKEEKIILVIDEYSSLKQNLPGCDSIFQSIIDKYIHVSNLKLILCGSNIKVMKDLVYESNPLYGRLSIKCNIKPLDYYESALFYPKFSNEDKVRIYSVFGGVPYYLQFIDDSLSVKDNILNLVASKDARLLNEVEQTISTEINKLANINDTFSAIASGKHTFSDILNSSHVSSSPTLADVLNKLTDMDIIEKVSPINENNKKHTFYLISDRLTLFYYTFIFKKSSFFATMPAEIFYEEFIAEQFETKFVPKAFELISKQFLLRMNLSGKIKPVLYNIGKYFYNDYKNKKNGEFDVVTLNRDGFDFYEVKFTKEPINDLIVKEEIDQLNSAPIKYNKIGFVSKSGFNISNPQDYILYSLDDIYS